MDRSTAFNTFYRVRVYVFAIQDEVVPYSFFVEDEEIVTSLEKALDGKQLDHEKILDIIYQPQAIFRVRAVTRCSSSLPGHAEAIVSASFSPDGRFLASGSGDTTVRFWDVNTELPLHVGRGECTLDYRCESRTGPLSCFVSTNP
jgi:ribosome assembly protein 4